MIQSTFDETSEDYKAFVEKFKPKKTTDDCYTPANIYEAVLEWAAAERAAAKVWKLSPREIEIQKILERRAEK